MASPRSSSRRPATPAPDIAAGTGAPLLIGQSLELWRGPLATVVAARNGSALKAAARSQLDAGAQALDVNAGAASLASELAWAASSLGAALPGVPLLLDCGDIEALAGALRATTAAATAVDPRHVGPLVANAFRPGDAAADALVDAAAAAGAGLVLSPAELDSALWADVPREPRPAEALAALLVRSREHALAGGVEGPLLADALAYPPALDAARCARSLATLRLLAAGDAALVPLVAVGNVGHGAPGALRPALRRLYAAAALGAGARALILPVEDRALVTTISALDRLPSRKVSRPPGEAPTAELPWLRRVARAAAGGRSLPAPPARAGSMPREAWELLVES
jgi:hypothetical protein